MDFNSFIVELNNSSHVASRWLLQIPLRCWAKHCFPLQTNYSHITNNMTGSINNQISNFKGMPIVRILKEIRKKIMIFVYKRHEPVKTWQMSCLHLLRGEYQKQWLNREHYLLYLGTTNPLKSYVHHLLKKIAFKNAYHHYSHLVLEESRWSLLLHNNLLPPIIIRDVGKPQTKGKKDDDEKQLF